MKYVVTRGILDGVHYSSLKRLPDDKTASVSLISMLEQNYSTHSVEMDCSIYFSEDFSAILKFLLEEALLKKISLNGSKALNFLDAWCKFSSLVSKTVLDKIDFEVLSHIPATQDHVNTFRLTKDIINDQYSVMMQNATGIVCTITLT